MNAALVPASDSLEVEYPGHAAVAQHFKGSRIRRRVKQKKQMAHFSSTAASVGLIKH